MSSVAVDVCDNYCPAEDYPQRPYLEGVPMSEITNYVMINIINIFDSLNQFFLYVFFQRQRESILSANETE